MLEKLVFDIEKYINLPIETLKALFKCVGNINKWTTLISLCHRKVKFHIKYYFLLFKYMFFFN